MAKCPVDGGVLLAWDKPPKRYPWFCPNNGTHGGNGQFYTNEDLEGFQQVEELIKEMVTAIQAGTMKSEDAVMIISRRTKKPEPMVRARLAVVLRLANNYKDIKSSRQSSIPTSSAAAPGSLKPHAGGTVAPDDFMAVMKEHGLNKKQAAEAIGRSVSRVHELTTTKGGSPALLELFKQKLSEYKPN